MSGDMRRCDVGRLGETEEETLLYFEMIRKMRPRVVGKRAPKTPRAILKVRILWRVFIDDQRLFYRRTETHEERERVTLTY